MCEFLKIEKLTLERVLFYPFTPAILFVLKPCYYPYFMRRKINLKFGRFWIFSQQAVITFGNGLSRGVAQESAGGGI